MWSATALDPSLPSQDRSAVPFVLLLQGWGQKLREAFRDRIMRDVRAALCCACAALCCLCCTVVAALPARLPVSRRCA